MLSPPRNSYENDPSGPSLDNIFADFTTDPADDGTVGRNEIADAIDARGREEDEARNGRSLVDDYLRD